MLCVKCFGLFARSPLYEHALLPMPTARDLVHILFMLVDDWGSYDASFRQRELDRKPDVSTPNIDRLADDGVKITNYYTQPICTPTRASLLSGRYSIHTGSEHILFGNSEPSCLPVRLVLMPEAFKQLGYAAHMIGKWHLGYVNDTCSPWSRGFDSFLGYLNGNEGYTFHGFSGLLDFHACNGSSAAVPALGGPASPPPPSACDTCAASYEGEYSTHVYTRRVQQLLTGWRAGAPPLFLYVAWQAVHEPMAAPQRYVDPFRSIGDPSRRIYAGMLAALDEGVGNISATLRATGMHNRSLMVLSGDNGGMSGTYGLPCCNCGTSCGGLNYPYRRRALSLRAPASSDSVVPLLPQVPRLEGLVLGGRFPWHRPDLLAAARGARQGPLRAAALGRGLVRHAAACRRLVGGRRRAGRRAARASGSAAAAEARRRWRSRRRPDR